MKLTPKQKIFCENYVLNGYNATQAYIAAGYSAKKEKTARENASRLLATNANVKLYISRLEGEKMENFKVEKNDFLKELGKMAFGNIDDIVEISEDGRIVLKKGIDPDKRRNFLAGVSGISSSSSYNKDGSSKSFSISAKDKLKAIELMARMTGVLDGGSDSGDGKGAVSKVLEALRNIGK